MKKECQNTISDKVKRFSPSYLYLIGTRYYFRYRIPRIYASTFTKKEVRVNLHTSFLLIARKRAYILYAEVQTYLEEIAMGKAKNKTIPVLNLNDDTQNKKSHNIQKELQEKIENDLPACKEESEDVNYNLAEILPLDEEIEEKPYYSTYKWANMYEGIFKELRQADKISISFNTVQRRLRGLLRYLLICDSENIKPRKEVHTDTLYFADFPLVDENEEMSDKELFSRFKERFDLFTNNEESIKEYLPALYIPTRYTHAFIALNEISEDNYLLLLNEYCKTMSKYYSILVARVNNNYSEEEVFLSNLDYTPYVETHMDIFPEKYPERKEELNISPQVILRSIQEILPIGTNKELNIFLQRILGGIQETAAIDTNNFSTNEKYLFDIIEEFINEKIDDRAWQPHMVSEHKGHFRQIERIFTNIPIHSITENEARTFRSVLRKLPPNWNRKKEYNDKSINEIIQIKHTKTLSPKTINTILQKASSLFTWAVKKRYIPFSPFENVSLEKDHELVKEKRLPFQLAELKQVFLSEDFKKNKNSKKPSYFWIPYISLYTGMRLEEIAQLYLTDIKKEGDYWYINITNLDNQGKHLKTKNANRSIPIHQRLIELGFIEYINKLQKSSHERVFADLKKTPSKDKYGHHITKFFSAHIRKLGIEKNKTFHSLRHNFAEFFEKKNLSNTSIFRQVFAHEQQDLASKQYGSPFTIEECYNQLIAKLDYDGI